MATGGPRQEAPAVDQALEDFNRIQLQFNDVKMEKLKLEDELKRQRAAAEAAQKMYVDADKALKKAERVIGKSKKHKDTRSALELLDEEMHQLKAQNENEFQGLLQNLAELGAANEQLEKAAKKKGVDPTLEPRLKELQEKLTQRAEIEAALNTEVSRLKEEALEAEQRYATAISKRLSSPSMISPDVDGGPDLSDVAEEAGAAVVTGEGGESAEPDESERASVLTKYRKLKATCAELRGLQNRAEEREKAGLTRIKALEDELAKAKAENQNLAAQLTEDAGGDGGEEVEKLNEKLKKKQKAFLDLQAETEKVYAESERLKKRVAELEEREAAEVASAEAAQVAEALKSQLAEATAELETQRQLAEKRKETLNSQANETQERIAAETEKYEAFSKKAEAETAELRAEVTSLKEKLESASATAKTNIEGAKQAKDLQAAKEWLERRVEEVQTEMTAKVTELEGELVSQKALAEKAEAEIEKAAAAHAEALAEKETEVAQIRKTVDEASGDRDLVEKKAGALLKDLKKQLKLEQRKTKKLEDALAAADGGGARASPGLSEANRAISVASLRSYGGSQESLASAHRVPSTPNSGSSAPKPESREPAAPPQLSSDEHTQLMMRMTAMQTDNAEMEDQIRFLRGKVRELQGELSQKSEVIMQYATRGASKGDTPTRSRKSILGMKGSVKGDKSGGKSSDHGVQTVLEETLMKNIQLQNMVELLQKELTTKSGIDRKEHDDRNVDTRTDTEVTSM